MQPKRRLELLAIASLVLLTGTGCAVQPNLPWALLASAFAALWLWGCYLPPFEFPAAPDGGVDASVDGGWTDDAGTGHWEACCKTAGDGGYEIGQCLCPPNQSCNYGWFARCSDGTCEPHGNLTCDRDLDGGAPDAGLDAGADAGGSWETCCDWRGDGGVLSTCFCPEGTACNYGWFAHCTDGSCAPTPDMCAP